MRKIKATISAFCAFICVFTAFASTDTAGLFTKNQEKNVPVTASAEISAQTNATENALLSPSSYQQYLNLSSPSDVAVCEDYTAIADGNVIYVYDQKNDVYRKYAHTANDASSKNNVTKLQFDNANNLYFLDASTYLYILDPVDLAVKETPTATATGFVCSTFNIQGNTLYFTNTSGGESQISKTPLNDLRISSATTLLEKLTLTPTLTFYNNELYYTDGGKYLRKINPATASGATFVAAFPSELLSMTITENVFYCATGNGEFFAYDLISLSESKQADLIQPLYKEAGGYSSLTRHGDFIYTVKKASVRQYSIEKTAFTAYDICGASASTHRLNNAADVCFAGDTLLIADNGNKRVSVYDAKNNAFKTPISSEINATFIASDENSVLVANATQTTLFDLSEQGYGKTLLSYDKFNGNIVGIASVYGKYYLVTEKNYFYALSKNENGVWSWNFAQKNSTRYPTLLTSDAHGNLYVVCGKNVYRYTEENFLTTLPQTTEIFNALPTQTKKLSVDYSGNLYALVGDAVQKFTAPAHSTGNYAAAQTYSLTDKTYVYGASLNAQSFAFGIEDNATYVLYKDDYLVKTAKLQLPTVKTIPVNGADKSIFNAESTVITIVNVKANALVVEFDLDALRGAQVFPYVDFKRVETQLTALKIGEEDGYDLLAYYDEEKREYSTYLVYSTSCEKLASDEYSSQYETTRTGYLSNAISLYKLPYLTKLLTVCDMPRGASVTLLGEINRLDHEYYYVSYTNENNEVKTGYIPKSYVAATNGEAKEELLTHGAKASNTDAIWRLVYILLGFGVIGVLVDYLILRKPKD